MSNKYKISTARLAEIIREEYASIIQEVHGKELSEKKKKKFPDLTGDGEVTQADILKARGVPLEGDDSDDDEETEAKSDKKKKAKKESVQSLKDLIQQEIAKL
mgnify:CR=1 FL=1